MKIIVIGASGVIGQAVAAELAQRHEVITVGSRSGQFQADITDIAQVRSLFDATGKVDAVVTTAGKAHFGPLVEMTPAHFAVGLNDKLMGQVNVALVAQEFLNDGGSITLTSGVLTEQPIRNGSGLSMANGALEAFARAAAIELPRGLRINVVSPTLLTESLDTYGPYFRGFETVPASRVALAYSKSVEGAQTGQVLRVGF